MKRAEKCVTVITYDFTNMRESNIKLPGVKEGIDDG